LNFRGTAGRTTSPLRGDHAKYHTRDLEKGEVSYSECVD